MTDFGPLFSLLIFPLISEGFALPGSSRTDI
jgi:hypothetical protein